MTTIASQARHIAVYHGGLYAAPLLFPRMSFCRGKSYAERLCAETFGHRTGSRRMVFAIAGSPLRGSVR